MGRSGRRSGHVVLAGVAGLSLLALGGAVLAESPAPDTARKVDGFFREVRLDRDKLHRERFDLSALLDSLDYAPARIVGFVRKDVAYEPYAGVLRGAEGTLLSRAGNALDTAILLARLLGDAGYDTRISLGTLTDAQADTLLARVVPPPPSPADDAPPIAASKPFAYAMAEAAKLREGLDAAGIALGGEKPARALHEEARHYAWVEYRLGAIDGWTAVYPFFDSPPGVTAARRFTQEVPEDLLHRVTIEMQIAQRIGGKTRVITVAGPWTRPAANLDGRLVTLSTAPHSVGLTTPAGELDAALDRAGLFTPVLAGTPGDKTFDLNGDTVDTRALGLDTFGASGLVQTVGKATGTATTALAGLGASTGNDRAARTLAGAWVRYTLTAPGGATTIWRRDLIGDLPATADAEARRRALARALTVRHGLMVATSRLPADYAAARAYDRLLATRPMWTAYRHYLDSGKIPLSPRDWPGAPALPQIALYRLFDRGAAAAAAGDRVYRDAPGLVVFRQGRRPNGDPFHAVDIVANPRRALDLSRGAPRPDPAALMRIGVWETAAEGQYQPPPASGARVTDAFSVFDAARTAGVGARWLRNARAAETPTLPPQGKAALAAELQQGFVALVPDGPVPGQRWSAWWRVDPATGNTLGMLSDGRGQEITEELIDEALLTYSMLKAVKGYADCGDYATMQERACCLIDTHIRNVAGMSMGEVLGGSLGAATGRVCDMASLAEDAALGPGPSSHGPYHCTMSAPGRTDRDVIGDHGLYDTSYYGCSAPQQTEDRAKNWAKKH